MSRIGKLPVVIPSGVEVKIDGHIVTVKGPKGELVREFNPIMTIKEEDGHVIVERPDDSRLAKSLHGLTRTLIHNM
ncbi:MAG: 50S ribosomal protein L6, partial [Eggerthellaceae bacterium]